MLTSIHLKMMYVCIKLFTSKLIKITSKLVLMTLVLEQYKMMQRPDSLIRKMIWILFIHVVADN
jgi:hypothetical protein